MSFPMPTPEDVVYRLVRLRRLIAFCIVLPLIAFALTGAAGFGWVGSVAGLLLCAVVLTVAIAGHAVVFPNAHQETIALSVVLFVLGIVGPFFGFFGWLFFAICAAIFLMVGQNWVLGWEMSRKQHNPTFQSKVKTRASLEEARNWFPLRPNSTRGHYRCGPANADGVFPVLYLPPTVDVFEEATSVSDEHVSEPSAEMASFFGKIEVDEGDHQRTNILEMNDANGPVQAVVETHFQALANGCRVIEVEVAQNYPWGQTLSIWLNDYAKDGLVYHRDLLEGRASHALRAAHRHSLLMLLGQKMMRRMVGDVPTGAFDAEQESSAEALGALLTRLGSDFTSKGHTSGPMPLVTLEEFFDGNGDDGSFQAASLGVARTALETLLARQDVSDVRMGITQWEGPSTWPLAEYVYVVTKAAPSEVASWLKETGLWMSELAEGNEHRVREKLEVPEGYRVVWGWID